MANTTGYVDIGDVIGPAAQAAGDPGMGGVGASRYPSFLQMGLEKLSFDIPWDKRTLTVERPEDRIIQLPGKITGCDNIWGYRGDACNPSWSGNIILKENYSHGGERGYFANDHWLNFNDAVYGSVGWLEPWNLYYGGIRNGKLYLSPQCCAFFFIRIEYVGIGVDNFCPGEPFRIPFFAREALTDFVTWKALEHRIYTEGKEQLFTGRYRDKQKELFGPGGTWAQALARWGGMDWKDMQDVALINTGIGRGA